jgi:hypothetical protein
MTSASSRRERTAERAQWQAAWRLLTRPEEPVLVARETLADFARRLAELVGPGQAAAALATAESRQALGQLLPKSQVEQARLLAVRSRHWQEQALRRLQAAGIETVVLKGLWLAERFYAEPLRRIGDDIDVLVRPAQLAQAVDCLQQEGLQFAGATLPAWGSIARASLPPLAAPDRSTAVDFHVEADEWPFSRALSNAAVFEQAMILERRGLVLRGLTDEACLLLLASNAAKDKFGPFALRKAIDALLILRRGGIDGALLQSLAVRGRLQRPLATLLALLVRLGLPPEAVPAGQRAALAGATFDRLSRDWQDLFRPLPGRWLGLWRETRLGAGWQVAAQRNLRRLGGLLRRRP